MYSIRKFWLKLPKFIFHNPHDFLTVIPNISQLIFLDTQGEELIFCYCLEWTKWLPLVQNWLSKFLQKIEYQVKTPIAPLRSEPHHSSEMTSQLLQGEKFTVFYETNNFAFGYSEEGYFGYVSVHQLTNFQENLFRSYDKSVDIPLGSKIFKQPKSYDFLQVIENYLQSPYLCGGRSNWGIDCSGLTQICLNSQDIYLPRDAYQQADFGKIIPYGEHQTGDLAFFGSSPQKISHVGIIWDEHHIVHAYGLVRKDKFTNKGIYHLDYQKITHELVVIKRYPMGFHFLDCLQH